MTGSKQATTREEQPRPVAVDTEVKPMAPSLMDQLRRVAQQQQQFVRQEQQWRLGLTLIQPQRMNISLCMERTVLEPLVKYLSDCSGRHVCFEHTSHPLFFKLTVDSRNFALFRMPNPSNARAFVQFWVEKYGRYGGLVELHSDRPLVAALVPRPV